MSRFEIHRRVRRLASGAAAALLLSLVPAPAHGQVYLKRLLGVESEPAEAASALDALTHTARQQVGIRYLWGGERPETGFDCSGLMRFVLEKVGVELPRTSAEQARVGVPVEPDVRRLRVGDLLTFGRGSRITHVGLYIGGGRYIHAHSPSGRVTEGRLPARGGTRGAWWRGVRRVVAMADSVEPNRSLP